VFCDLDHPLSDVCELFGPAVGQLFRRRLCVGQRAAGLDSNSDRLRRPILRSVAITGFLVSDISCVRYPEDAPRSLRRCQSGSGARANGCLTVSVGQSRYRRISERELTRTLMQRREPAHPTCRQMHRSAPARAGRCLVDTRVMHVQPIAPSTG
jgi:hypothetical protein